MKGGAKATIIGAKHVPGARVAVSLRPALTGFSCSLALSLRRAGTFRADASLTRSETDKLRGKDS